MKTKKAIAVLLLFVILVLTVACGENKPSIAPKMWKVTSRDGNVLYLFGTIHVGDERSDEAFETVKPYFDECDALAVEFDAVAYAKDTETMMRDMSKFVMTDGKTIRDVLGNELYDKAVALLQDAGFYVPLIDYYNSAMWSQMITQALISKTDLKTEKAMDSLLTDYAYKSSIPVYSVESAEMQYNLLLEAPERYNILSIEQLIENAAAFTGQTETMYKAWLEGKLDVFMAATEEMDEGALNEEDAKVVEEFNGRLLTQRNLGMAEKAEEYLKSGKKVFFAVGAGHMMGDDGLVALLERAGFTVEEINR